MRISELHLLSNDTRAQEAFYRTKLGVNSIRYSPLHLKIQVGETVVHFHDHSGPTVFYHFAFLVPTGCLDAAMNFLDSQSIPILLNNGEAFTHFDNGKAIYFEDADRNIAEFIERPLVSTGTQSHFDIQDIVRLNEISLSCPGPLAKAQELQDKHGIKPLSTERFDDEFCWVGDHEGVILVAKTGRHWLPTDRAGIHAPFKVRYEEAGKEFNFNFKFPKL